MRDGNATIVDGNATVVDGFTTDADGMCGRPDMKSKPPSRKSLASDHKRLTKAWQPAQGCAMSGAVGSLTAAASNEAGESKPCNPVIVKVP
jgi:hypothetical protein